MRGLARCEDWGYARTGVMRGLVYARTCMMRCEDWVLCENRGYLRAGFAQGLGSYEYWIFFWDGRYPRANTVVEQRHSLSNPSQIPLESCNTV